MLGIFRKNNSSEQPKRKKTSKQTAGPSKSDFKKQYSHTIKTILLLKAEFEDAKKLAKTPKEEKMLSIIESKILDLI